MLWFMGSQRVKTEQLNNIKTQSKVNMFVSDS